MCDAVALALGSIPKGLAPAEPVSARSGLTDQELHKEGPFLRGLSEVQLPK